VLRSSRSNRFVFVARVRARPDFTSCFTDPITVHFANRDDRVIGGCGYVRRSVRLYKEIIY
jgi:hypothetical protein